VASLKTASVAWALTRALIVALAVAGYLLSGLPERGVDPAVPHLLSFLGGWDTTWYLDIARHGYETDTAIVGSVFTNLAFFPLLPGVMAAALAVSVNPFAAALVVGNLAFLGGLVAFGRLTARRQGAAAGARAVWTLALFPPALYCALAYTEGIAVACAIGAGLAAVRRRYLLAGCLGAVAALTRPTGILVALLVGLLALYEPAPGRLRRLALAVVPSIVAVGAFLAWMAVARGSAFLPLDAQAAWDRGRLGTGLVTAAPHEIAAGWRLVRAGHFTAAWTATFRDVGFLVVYLVLLVRLWRSDGGLRSPWVVYSAATILVPISSGTITSLARFGLMAFPLLWPIADWVGDDRRRQGWTAAAAVVVTAALVAQLAIRSP
jgi:hypothetical protein